MRQTRRHNPQRRLNGRQDEHRTHRPGHIHGVHKFIEIANPQDTRDAHEAAQQHHARDGSLLPCRHLQLEDLRDWDQHDDDVVDHVDDAHGEEELLHVDAGALGAAELVPVKGHGLAGVGHGDGCDDWVGAGEEEAEVEGEAEEEVVGYEDAAVEEEYGEFGGGAGEGVDEGIAVDDLDMLVEMGGVVVCVGRY